MIFSTYSAVLYNLKVLYINFLPSTVRQGAISCIISRRNLQLFGSLRVPLHELAQSQGVHLHMGAPLCFRPHQGADQWILAPRDETSGGLC